MKSDEIVPSLFVVPIVGLNDNRDCGPFLGTGVFVGELKHLITCNHVLDKWKGKYGMTAHEDNPKFYEAEVLVRDMNSDLACLKVNEYTPPHSCPLADDNDIILNDFVCCFEYGTTIVAGNKINFSPANRLGNITRFRNMTDRYKLAGDHMLELSFPAMKGASGAPVMNWRPPFKLFGVVTANVGYELLPAQIEKIVDDSGNISEETKFYLPQGLAIHVKHVKAIIAKLL